MDIVNAPYLFARILYLYLVFYGVFVLLLYVAITFNDHLIVIALCSITDWGV